MWAYNPYKPESYCSVYLSYNQTAPSGIWITVAYDTKLYDLANEFDITNHRFWPKKTGYYHVDVSVCLLVAADNMRALVYLYVNSVPVKSIWRYTYSVTARMYILSCDLYLQKGDYVYVDFQHLAGSAKYLSGLPANTYFNIHKFA